MKNTKKWLLVVVVLSVVTGAATLLNACGASTATTFYGAGR
jgi:hypothetical protein